MGRNENLTYKILELVEEKPYCSSSAVVIEGYNKDSVFKQLKFILKDNLILAEPFTDGNGEIVSLNNIHLTLRGLIYMRKLTSILAV